MPVSVFTRADNTCQSSTTPVTPKPEGRGNVETGGWSTAEAGVCWGTLPTCPRKQQALWVQQPPCGTGCMFWAFVHEPVTQEVRGTGLSPLSCRSRHLSERQIATRRGLHQHWLLTALHLLPYLPYRGQGTMGTSAEQGRKRL